MPASGAIIGTPNKIPRVRCTKAEAGYDAVQTQLVKMRRSGAIPYERITDGTRWARRFKTCGSPADAIAEIARDYRRRIVDASAGEQEATINGECFAIGTLAGANGIPTAFARRTLRWLGLRPVYPATTAAVPGIPPNWNGRSRALLPMGCDSRGRRSVPDSRSGIPIPSCTPRPRSSGNGTESRALKLRMPHSPVTSRRIARAPSRAPLNTENRGVSCQLRQSSPRPRR
jgi:hypothetical protein